MLQQQHIWQLRQSSRSTVLFPINFCLQITQISSIRNTKFYKYHLPNINYIHPSEYCSTTKIDLTSKNLLHNTSVSYCYLQISLTCLRSCLSSIAFKRQFQCKQLFLDYRLQLLHLTSIACVAGPGGLQDEGQVIEAVTIHHPPEALQANGSLANILVAVQVVAGLAW